MDAPDFNDSEKRIVKSYDQDVSYPKTVRDMIRHIQQSLPSAESGRLLSMKNMKCVLITW